MRTPGDAEGASWACNMRTSARRRAGDAATATCPAQKNSSRTWTTIFDKVKPWDLSTVTAKAWRIGNSLLVTFILKTENSKSTRGRSTLGPHCGVSGAESEVGVAGQCGDY